MVTPGMVVGGPLFSVYMRLKLDVSPEQVVKLRRVLHYNGLPIDARSVSDEIVRQEGK